MKNAGGWRLADERTGKEIKAGDEVMTFRGDYGELIGSRPPAHSGSSGRVLVRQVGSDFVDEWFPGVIGAKFVGAD